MFKHSLCPITGADKNTRDHLKKSARQPPLSIQRKLIRRHKSLNGQMIWCGLQVLPQGQHIYGVTAKIIHTGLQLILLLTKPQHQRCLCHHVGPVCFSMRQNGEGLLVSGTRVSYWMGESCHRLDILSKYLDTRIQQYFDSMIVSQKIGRECFHCCVRV